MMHIKSNSYCKLLFILGIFLFSLFITANQCGAIENKAPFMVQMEHSPFQVDQTKNYFDLNLPSNQPITLSVQIHNLVDYPINLSISANQATTNLNGVVEYSPSTNELSKGVPLKLSESVTVLQPKITIPAKDTIQTTFLVNLPNNQFAGVLAGGLTFLDTTSKNQTTDEAFNNRFAYTIALLIHGILPIQENKIAIQSPKMTSVNHKKALLVTLENQRANYVNQMKVKVTVYNSKRQKVANFSKNHIQMAPNSLGKLPFFLDDWSLKPDKYQVKIAVLTKQNNWSEIKWLQIKPNQLPSLPRKSISYSETQVLKIVISVLLICIFILVVVIFYLVKRKKRIS